MSRDPNKLAFKEKVGYSFGDVSSNFLFKTFLIFLMPFYTDVYGLRPEQVATMFLVTRLWDTVNDPMMGIIADRTNTRWGKFRPYLVWFAIPFAVLGVLTYTTPDFDPTGKLIWAWATYTLMMMVYTAINIPYSALMGVISPDPIERTSVSSYRMIGANLGGVFVEVTCLYMVAKLGAGDEQAGYQRTFMVYGVLAIIFWLACFKMTRERVKPIHTEKHSVGRDLADLFSNGPWFALGLISILQITTIAIRLASQVYYFKYKIGLGAELGLLMGFGTACWVLGAFLSPFCTRWVGNKRMAFLLFMVFNGVTTMLYYFGEPGGLIFLYFLAFVSSIGAGAAAPLLWSMYADTADYSEWKTGRRATGLVVSAGVFAQKAGWAIGPAIGGYMLGAAGYVANAEQTDEVLNIIVHMMSTIPGIGSVIAGAAILIYRIDDKLLAKVTRELKAKAAD